MLVGTLLLGLLLGYLIWGWTRRKLIDAEGRIASITHTNTNLEQQLIVLNTRNISMEAINKLSVNSSLFVLEMKYSYGQIVKFFSAAHLKDLFFYPT